MIPRVVSPHGASAGSPSANLGADLYLQGPQPVPSFTKSPVLTETTQANHKTPEFFQPEPVLTGYSVRSEANTEAKRFALQQLMHLEGRLAELQPQVVRLR